MRYGNQVISSIKLGSQIIINKIIKGFEVVYETWRKITKKGTSSVVLTDCKYSIPRLPEEYQEVEYIEATGTQYIDTNFYPDSNSAIEMDVLMPTTTFGASKNNFIFGVTNDATNTKRFATNVFLNINLDKLEVYPRYSTNAPSSGVTFINFDEWHNIRIDKGSYYLDNELLVSYDTTFEKNEYPLYINAYNSYGTVNTGYIGNIKIKSCKIWDNDILVRDMIPCYRKSDNIIGMYDLVNDAFYENSGTETFLKGKNIAENVYALDYKISGNSYTYGGLPIDYQQVEYIQTTGTQYIDSGVPLKSGLKTIVDWVYANANSGNSYTGGHIGSSPGNRWLIGSQKTNNEYFFGVGSMNVSTLIQFGNRDIVEAYWQNKGSYIKINGVEPANAANIANSALEEAPDYTFYMGGLNRDGNINLLPKLIIYGWKFYQDDVLIRDYIPCYRKSDNEIGLYDLVENKFYTNNGTDTLLKGNDILPTPEAPIEIKSVGEKTNNLYNGNILKTLRASCNVEQIGSNIKVIATTTDGYNCVRAGYNLDLFPKDTDLVLSFEAEEYGDAKSYVVGRLYDESLSTLIQAINFTKLEENTYKFKIPSDVEGAIYFTIVWYSNYSSVSNIGDYVIYKNIKIEAGNEKTNYEPYGYKIPVKVSDELGNETTINIYLKEPLRKMGGYADYIDFENQKAITLVDRKTFDGTENWELHTNIAEGCVFRLDGVLTPQLNAPQTSTYMTHFALTNTYGTSNFIPGEYRLSSNDSVTAITGSRLYVSSTHATIDEFKEWLAINKPTLCYPLETSEEIDEEFLPIKITSSEMNIQILTDISPSEIEVTYIGKE